MTSGPALSARPPCSHPSALSAQVLGLGSRAWRFYSSGGLEGPGTLWVPLQERSFLAAGGHECGRQRPKEEICEGAGTLWVPPSRSHRTVKKGKAPPRKRGGAFERWDDVAS